MKLRSLIVLLFFSCVLFAQDYLKKTDSILGLNSHDSDKVKILSRIGRKIFKTDIQASTYYMETALPMAEKLKLNRHLATLYNNLSNNYLDQGDYNKAFIYGMKDVELAKQTNRKADLINSYTTLGNIYSLKGDKINAKLYYVTALKYCDEDKYIGSITDINLNISSLFDFITEKDSAIKYFTACLKPFEQKADWAGVAIVKNNLGEVYKANKEFDKALQCFMEAKKIISKLNDKKSMMIYMSNIGNVYYETGKYEKAFNELYNAMVLHSKDGFNEELLGVYKGLTKVSAAIRDFEKAYYYLNKYNQLKDSVFSIESLDKFAELRSGYMKELDKSQIELLKKENEIKEGRHRTTLYIIGFACIFMVVIGALVFNRFRLKKRSEEALKAKNALIEEKNKEILDSIHYAKRIQSSLITSEKYIEKNIDRLKNGDQK